MNREGSIARTLIFMLFGPIVWALHLTVSYGGHAVLCVVGPSEHGGMLPTLLGAATGIAGLVLITALIWPELLRRLLKAMPASSPEAGFAVTVMRLLGFLSLLGVAFAGMAILTLPLCQPLR